MRIITSFVFRKNIYRIIEGILFLLILLTGYFIHDYNKQYSIEGEFIFQSSNNCTISLFYDTGHDYRGYDSKSYSYLSTYGMVKYSFRTNSRIIRGLKIVLNNKDASFEIKGFILKTGGDDYNILVHKYKSLNQLVAIKSNGDTLSLKSAFIEGFDPYIEYRFEKEVRYKNNNRVFMLYILIIALGVILLLVIIKQHSFFSLFSRSNISKISEKVKPIYAFASVSVIKLWLVAHQTISAYDAGHDDKFFVSRAISMMQGHWMGHYNHMTLIKGPFYSFWLSLCFVSGIPLLFAQHLLYILSCGLLIVAIRPLVPRLSIRFVIYIILLFNPMNYMSAATTRVIRDVICPDLTIMIVACAIGLLFSIKEIGIENSRLPFL